MVKELILFRLPLGEKTDEFNALFRQVQEEMEKLGVKPGVRWGTVAGSRTAIIEREFDSLAEYEADDAAFHGGKEFMALWRRMEACADSMEVLLWQTQRSAAEVAAARAR